MRALYIGRFQPFHLGHLSVIQKAIQEVDKLIIGIGSAEMNYLPDNPFTGSERYQMVEKTMESENITTDKYTIIPIRNIHNYALWVDHLSLYLPPFKAVYTGSPIVKQLLKKSMHNYEIRDIEKTIETSSTIVRDNILNNDDSWQTQVPQVVAEFIKSIDGVERIQHLKTTEENGEEFSKIQEQTKI